MKLLLTLDDKNYTDDMEIFEKYAVRAVICKNGRYAMQQSAEGEYKIPGGGVEAGETFTDALIREVSEELGFLIIPESIREIGEILEVRRDVFNPEIKYVCHSYFYKCEIEDKTVDTHMTQSEIDKGFEPVWAEPERIIAMNRKFNSPVSNRRDTEFIRLLLNPDFLSDIERLK